mmetsp:Transcript_14093/g.15751  ORF Transcript_14093/g.15751 Transcript_14093/m.15751 type:complete len:268 (+) Transcript_14093:36-839(+)|eukprot:CAMPEP_0205826438 /NCGR_PEP_ID=MMETSP0206-20130828/28625_1 /ASSEMBLY_ACC=CAM_ASM_000279 /TAXON_ID=36767 /ORGANISM="Euplotes focardii, Strain TN1" /LENGTH=267 /DNA_ID=CAMNT_0053126351 /DNA_START=34 /DNA_END=837 /DNA_ORIENTATION=+
MGRLSGKIAVVTGAGSGLGRATAVLFATEGAKVCCVDYNEKGAQETSATINRSQHGRAFAVGCDVSDEVAHQSMVDLVIETWGRIDVFFANAGVTGAPAPLQHINMDDVIRTFKVNVLGPLIGIKQASKAMQEKGNAGSVICTASVAGLRSGAGPIPYSASKAAVINLVATSANELALTGIRVNAVCPGLFETGMTAGIFDRARELGSAHKIGQLNPTGRSGRPQELANAVLFLASDEASYITGQALPVCGGLSSSLPVVPRRPAKL